jgi:CRP-like cAMP-binding protein
VTVHRWAKSEKVGVLAKIPLFEACSRRDLAQVAEISVEAELPAGSVLTRQDHDGALAFVVLEGEVEVTRGDMVLGTLGAGDMAGELSLIDGRPRSANVAATTDVRVLQIAAEDFDALLDRSPQFTKNLLRSLSHRIRDMDERWRAAL